MVNMKEVARMAGVSISTVSHVINNTRFVSEEVKERVNKAMEETGYVPNIVAHSLRTKKTNTIGLVVPINNDENSNIFIMQISLGIDSVMRKRGYFTLMTNTWDNINREIQEIHHMMTRQIDGLIIIPSVGNHDFIPEIIKDKEYVFVDRIPQGIKDPDVVLGDSFNSSYEAVSKMIQRGYKKIGILCSKIGKFSNSDERLNAFKKAHLDNNLILNEEYICECDETIESACKKTSWLIGNTDITALFITTNLMGMGAVKYLNEAKIKIPNDISLTVFDDYAWTSINNPSITTIHQNAFEMGRQSAKLLLKKLGLNEEEKAKWTPKEIRLPAELIIRDSWK